VLSFELPKEGMLVVEIEQAAVIFVAPWDGVLLSNEKTKSNMRTLGFHVQSDSDDQG